MPLEKSLHPRQMGYYLELVLIDLQLYCDNSCFCKANFFSVCQILIHHKILHVESIW